MALLARDARSSDYDAFLRFLAELGVADILPTREEFGVRIAPNAFFLVEAEVPLAYGFIRPLLDTAHVVHVVVAQERRRLGLGRAVMQEAAVRARAAGCTNWYLNVRKDNAAAISLYESFGLHTSYESVLVQLAWDDVARVAGNNAVVISDVDRASELPLEKAFELPRGLLASFRNAPERVLHVVHDAARPVAIAAFDPDSRQISLFRVVSPEYARPLLESIRTQMPSGPSFVRLFVEGDVGLAHVLQASGGMEQLRTLRMSGSIERDMAAK